MTVTRAFVAADRALARVVSQVRDDQWDRPVPVEQVPRMGGGDATLRELLAYHAYDEAWVPDMVAGRTMDEVGRDAYAGDLLGADPRAAYAALVERAVGAVEQVADLDGPVHFSYGTVPLREGLWHLTTFRALRTVDLARFVGTDDTLDPELVQALWDELSPRAEQLRAMGVFGPAREVEPDAPLQERLLAMTGRRPRA